MQIKLLQVLQERTFTPLGGHEKKRFSGRVIAATNRPLAQLRRDGRFRDDFFYRLCSDVIEVPPLRQRIAESAGELELLVRLLVGRIAGTQDSELVAEVLEALESGLPRGYTWPGNVRELEQAVRRILITGRYAADLAPAGPDEETALVEKLRSGERPRSSSPAIAPCSTGALGRMPRWPSALGLTRARHANTSKAQNPAIQRAPARIDQHVLSPRLFTD